MNIAQILVRIFRPKECYKYWYVYKNNNEACDCLITCKYPPPSSKKLAVVKIPVRK